MEPHKIKEIADIRIDGQKFVCFVLNDGSKYIAANICKLFKSGNIVEPAEINQDRETKGRVYTLETVIDNLKPRILRQLAMNGLIHKINETIYQKHNPQERVLSEFDKMIMQAINHKL
jgi:hypothetical protein